MLGTDSFVQAALKPLGLIPPGTVYAHGYQHDDMVTGARDQNNGRPEVVGTALTGFLLQTLAS